MMDYQKALNKSAALCSKQEYCREDIRKKHEKWEVKTEDSEKILHYLIKEKFINEIRYARFFVRDKFRFNRWGRQKIRWQLKQKKVAPEIIEEALKQISQKEYLQTLEELISQKMKQVNHKDPYKRKASLINNAVSKGFEYDAILPILERLSTPLE